MPILATTKKTSSTPSIDEGSYAARIYKIIHIGTYPDYTGVAKNKVMITFEFPTELKVFKEELGEQPVSLSKEYTLSTHEKAGLRKLILACDPKALKTDDDGFAEEYDIEKLLGKSCLVSIEYSERGENTYANIKVETVLPKGMVCPPQINESVSLNYDNFNETAFSTLPLFIKEKMQSSYEYKKMNQDPLDVPFKGNGISAEELDLSDIPFN